MRKILLSLLSVILLTCSLRSENRITPLYFNEDNVLILNGTWDFKYIPSLSIGEDSLFYLNDYDITKWDKIKVPGNWELQGFTEPSYKAVAEGTGLYKTEFSVPESFKNQQIFIHFEGVQYAYKFYVNGKEAGEWSSSYNGASFNITNLVKFGTSNYLAVKVVTRTKGYQFDINDGWALSGIFRYVSVFSTPNLFIDDYTVRTYFNDDLAANVEVNVKLQNKKNDDFAKYSLKTVLKSPKGDIVQEILKDDVSLDNNVLLKVKEPALWTAETPDLYSLEIFLLNNGKVSQKINQKVGIREITIDRAVLKLNGNPIKLRGVNCHDITPETGRTLTRQQILDDLLLIKKANINFIRTSHYPPDRRKLDLCDSLGLYVVCEVAFGFGNSFLEDSTYQDILLTRAKATLLRDKNHPSVIIWSLGNENPITPITNVTCQYVKETDKTRPVCYPGSHKETSIPDPTDLCTPHYQTAAWIKDFSKETERPILLTEYAHALGLSFGNLEDVWHEMFRSKESAGGAIWHFEDQGLLQTAKEPVNTSDLATDVWIDSMHYYKTTLDGADGIVYADRTPQIDYWHVKKVYSPIQIIESQIPVTRGKQTLRFSLYNQFDFTNMNTLKGKWILYKNSNVFHQGKITVNCAPHDTVFYDLPIELPQNYEESIWLLSFSFTDLENEKIYDHNIYLHAVDDNLKTIKNTIVEANQAKSVKVSENKYSVGIKAGNLGYKIHKEDLRIEIGINDKIICNTPFYARTGRNPKMADVTVRDKFSSEADDYFWHPWILEPKEISKFSKQTKKDECIISTNEIYERGSNFPKQKLVGDIQFSIKNTGALDIEYKLTPENASGVFLEAGISFVLPANISYFYWLGDGPYPSFPDKHVLNNFGFHSIHKNDINFNGNRANVEMAIFADKDGNGIAVLGNKANISVELKNGRIIVSHVPIVSGLGNKKTKPLYISWAKDIQEINGEFTIIPLQQDNWPERLNEIFGVPFELPKLFNPFYYSYDTTK